MPVRRVIFNGLFRHRKCGNTVLPIKRTVAIKVCNARLIFSYHRGLQASPLHTIYAREHSSGRTELVSCLNDKNTIAVLIGTSAGEFNNLVSSPGICATPAQTA